MNKHLLSFISALLLTVLSLGLNSSCANPTTISVSEGTELEMKYADLLTLTQCDGYIHAQISNPWDSTRLLHSYILIDKDAEIPSNLPKGDIVRTPISNAVVYTSVHCGLINQLGAYDCIRGICDLKYIKLDKLQSDCKSGKVKNLGEGTNPNIEAIIDMQPDAILLSPFQNSGTYGKIGKLGIPIIECADYMETSALGRAEWMKFYGILTGKAYEADTTFTALATRYNSMKDKVVKYLNSDLAPKDTPRMTATVSKPSVITDLKFGNTWYVPGGKSTIGRLIADAGGNYLYSNTKESGSLALSPEEVFDRAIDADVWILKYNQATDKTYAEIAQEYSNYSNMAAFKSRQVYGCNTAVSAFYEETPFHPDLLLMDYIKIFHPSILPDYELKYYKKIKE